MAEDDIYGSKSKYENFVKNLSKVLTKPKNGVYYCKNKKNLKYFKKLFDCFEAKDLSYIRRNKIIYNLRITTFATEKDLKACDRDEINKIVAFMHKRYHSIESKKDFIKDIKVIWKLLFPEKDFQGRLDETLTPYAVRHLSWKVDKSKEKLRNDRITHEEFKKILNFFSNDPKIQAYLMLAFESLGRPQELLYTKIKDYEFNDNFAKVWISEHGKEGTGFLQCIDSYPYVIQWFRVHPLKDDPNAFFFINENNRKKYGQLKNHNINLRLKKACKQLNIDKRITCYSLKRNGITYRRLRGDSDTQIQHAARWTSTKQLKVYDLSTQQDALEIELKKRGIVKGKDELEETKTKKCGFCGYENGFVEEFCDNCKRPLDRTKLREMAESHERMMQNEFMGRFDKMEKMFDKMVKS